MHHGGHAPHKVVELHPGHDRALIRGGRVLRRGEGLGHSARLPEPDGRPWREPATPRMD